MSCGSGLVCHVEKMASHPMFGSTTVYGTTFGHLGYYGFTNTITLPCDSYYGGIHPLGNVTFAFTRVVAKISSIAWPQMNFTLTTAQYPFFFPLDSNNAYQKRWIPAYHQSTYWNIKRNSSTIWPGGVAPILRAYPDGLTEVVPPGFQFCYSNMDLFDIGVYQWFAGQMLYATDQL